MKTRRLYTSLFTPEMAERFFNLWIPLEQRYFEKTDAAARCGLILEVES